MMLFGFYLANNARGETVTIKPSLRLGEWYDSNPFMWGEDQDIKSDFITELSPQISISSITKRVRLNASYRLDSRHYNRYRELDNISHTGNFNSSVGISRKSSLKIGDFFRFTPDSLRATDLGIQIKRIDILSNTVFVSMDRNFSRTFYTSLTLKDSILDFDDAAFIDSRTDSAALSGNYRWKPGTLITVAYTYTNYHFDTQTDGNDIKNHSVTLALAEQLSADASVNISGGIVHTQDVDEKPYWMANAGFAKTYSASSLNLGYSRSVANSSGLIDELNINESVSIRWNYIFSRSFNAKVNGNLSQNRSKPSGSLNTTSYSAGAGFVWLAYSWITFNAKYSHFQQWTETVLSSNMKKDMVFIGVTATMNQLRF